MKKPEIHVFTNIQKIAEKIVQSDHFIDDQREDIRCIKLQFPYKINLR